MSRAQRLLDLIQELRRHGYPVSGAALAETLGVSLRTLYRDVATLNAQGAHIAGEPGVGYVLRPGFMLPPLMFSEDEIEALARWVAERADAPLSDAARHALAKIAAVLPDDLKDDLDSSGLFIGPGEPMTGGEVELPKIRKAIRREWKLRISYIDGDGAQTRRVIWPFALAFFDRARVIAAWCELRNGYRHFHTDRVTALTVTEKRYPRRRQVLLKEWRRSSVFPCKRLLTEIDSMDR
jgi:predicted DNA-binding transcriptional regulator YafY